MTGTTTHAFDQPTSPMPSPIRHTVRPLATILALLAITVANAAAQSRSASGTSALAPRDEWQRVPDIIAAMGGVEGKRVADVAAGQGYLTRWLSQHAGPNGRVFAVEIGDVERQALRKLAQDSFPNVVVVDGTPTDPRLPDTLDAVVVLNSYHEFASYRDMLSGIRRALRPGGLLVLVDNDASQSTESREWQASHHGLNPKFVVAELEEAGFEIVTRRDDFIVQPYPQWMIVARRAAAP